MHTRRFFWPTLICFVIGIASCQKEIATQQESQGTNFNTLLKTVSQNITGSGLNITTNYTYNTSGQVAEIARTFSSSTGSPGIQKDVYCRNSASRLDSIIYINVAAPQDPGFNNLYKTAFHYTTDGKIAYTLNKTKLSNYPEDSTVYSYQGSSISQRVVYRKPSGSPVYTVTITFSYQYDAAANVSNIDVVWSSPVGSKSCTFTYDNKPNTLPVMEYENELYGNWIKAFDNMFTTSNNIVSRRVQPGWDWDWGNKDFEYRYSSNNKPLYQKVKHSDSPGYYEVFYYYD